MSLEIQEEGGGSGTVVVVVELLRHLDADGVAAKNRSGYDALHVAAREGHHVFSSSFATKINCWLLKKEYDGKDPDLNELAGQCQEHVEYSPGTARKGHKKYQRQPQNVDLPEIHPKNKKKPFPIMWPDAHL